MPAWFQDQCLFQQWESTLPPYFSFLLCCCYMNSKMQTMPNGHSMKRTTAVHLSVPLITIYYPTPVCQSFFQWPVLSSHLKIDTVPFPMLPASCRPFWHLFQLFLSTRSSVLTFLCKLFTGVLSHSLRDLLRSLLTLSSYISSGPLSQFHWDKVSLSDTTFLFRLDSLAQHPKKSVKQRIGIATTNSGQL